MQSPAIAVNGDAVADPENAAASIHAESTGFGDNALEELLVDQLRDILYAEKQLTKALPWSKQRKEEPAAALADWRSGWSTTNAYTTARNLALHMRNRTLAQLLTASLGEEQNAAQLLDQIMQPLLSRLPAAVE